MTKFKRSVVAIMASMAFSVGAIADVIDTTAKENTKISDKKEIGVLSLYNFKTNEHTRIDNPEKMSVEAGRDYVPQIPESISLYDMFINKGAKPMEAVAYTYAEVYSVIQGMVE